jgi:hypothetical protein
VDGKLDFDVCDRIAAAGSVEHRELHPDKIIISITTTTKSPIIYHQFTTTSISELTEQQLPPAASTTETR